MAFLDFVNNDLHVFFDDFATPHTLNGKTIKASVDNERLKELMGKDFDGLYEAFLYFEAKKADFDKRPKNGDIAIFDSRNMTYLDVMENEGIYQIILQSNRV